MWRNLVLGELAIALRCSGGDVARRLPLVDPPAHELGHRDLGALDVAAPAQIGDQFGLLNLSLTLGALDRMPLAFTPASLRIARFEDDGPVAGRALADVALHLDS